MARSSLMTWEPGPRRWRKEYRGKTYTVSCRALGSEPTKGGSYLAANEWWRARQAELDLTPPSPPPPRPHAERLEELSRRRGWAQLNAREVEARNLESEMARVESRGEPADELELQRAMYKAQCAAEPPAPERLRDLYGGTERLWEDRLSREADPVAENLTVGGQVEAWLKGLEVRVGARRLAADRFDNIRRNIHRFRDFAGSARPVASIDEPLVGSYYGHLLGLVGLRLDDPAGKAGISSVYADSIWGQFRRFVVYLWTMRLAERPRNLDDHALRFDLGPRKVETFTLAEVARLLDAATGQLRLHLLLMINCGFGPSDIATLEDAEVRWAEGRIVRKRSKTRDHAEVPEVDYKLWPRTAELLREYRSGGPVVLLTVTGRRWVFEELTAEGKLRSTDSVASNFNRLRDKLEIPKPLKSLRQTSASILVSHAHYGRLKGHFLGHSPRGLAERNYAAPSSELFDAAVAWLGEQYGLMPIAATKVK